MSTRSDITAADGYFKGEAKIFRFTVRDLAKQVIPIAGWSIQMRLSDVKFGAAIKTKTGAVSGDGTSGIVNVTWAAVDSADLEPRGSPDEDEPYYYSVRRIDIGSETELAFGELTLLERWVD